MKYFKLYLKTVFPLSFLTYFFVSFFLFSAQGNAQQLKKLIKEGISKNPKIQFFELKYKIASEKEKEANTLPNTQISVGYFVSEPETRTGAQRFKISANQMLPSFGTITARENYLNSLADAVYLDVVVAKRELMVSISKSYYTLYALKEKNIILKQNISLLKTYEKLALTAIEVGKASVVDVLRLQMRQNELKQLKDVLEQNYLAEQTVINKLLNREKHREISLDMTWIIPSKNNLINPDNLSLHPELLKYDKLYRSVEKLEILNQKEKNIKFGFGLNYIAVSKRKNLLFNDNGKDILMPMIRISIPIFNHKYASKTKQNELQKRKIIAQKENRLNILETLLDKAIKNSNSAKIRFNIQSENLKKAKDAQTILMKNYQTGGILFKDVLDIQELQLKFQINQIQAVKDYYLQETNIHYLSK